MPSPAQVREAVQRGSDNFPTHFPDDEYGHSFPTSILQASLQNGEVIQRDWLAWSKTKKALFCFPCRLFSKLPSGNRSFLTCASGYSTCQRWKKITIPEHSSSNNHKMCYIQWRDMEKSLQCDSTVDQYLLHNIRSKAAYWKQILHRILDVTLFLGERG